MVMSTLVAGKLARGSSPNLQTKAQTQTQTEAETDTTQTHSTQHTTQQRHFGGEIQ